MRLDVAFNWWKDWAKENRAENTAYSQGAILKQWINTLPKNQQLEKLTSNEVQDFINREDGVSLSQRRFRLASINSLLSLMKARGHCKGNVAAKLRVNMKRLTHKQKEKRVKNP